MILNHTILYCVQMAGVETVLDILPAVNDRDSSVEGMMPHTENTECSLISPVRQAAPVVQPTGDRSA